MDDAATSPIYFSQMGFLGLPSLAIFHRRVGSPEPLPDNDSTTHNDSDASDLVHMRMEPSSPTARHIRTHRVEEVSKAPLPPKGMRWFIRRSAAVGPAPVSFEKGSKEPITTEHPQPPAIPVTPSTSERCSTTPLATSTLPLGKTMNAMFFAMLVLALCCGMDGASASPQQTDPKDVIGLIYTGWPACARACYDARFNYVGNLCRESVDRIVDADRCARLTCSPDDYNRLKNTYRDFANACDQIYPTTTTMVSTTSQTSTTSGTATVSVATSTTAATSLTTTAAATTTGTGITAGGNGSTSGAERVGLGLGGAVAVMAFLLTWA
ncbi:hypothetical protein HDU96_003261 [Phlyctochytrium bullatum]|nr:hypothetical protein HDU96_003261 [Phlyctochytrium bullatum]